MITLVRVVETSSACPSQWDAWDSGGNYYYLRYRHGCGSVRHYKTRDWVRSGQDELIEVIATFEHGHPLDGAISLEDFALLAGITVAPGAMVTRFGDYLRDELIMRGVISPAMLEEGLPGRARQAYLDLSSL